MNRFARHRRITISDVAALAGVSKTTVSHVLSNNRPVALRTRKRVEQAIDDLGYRPDRLARSLRTRRTHMVALIIPDITNPFYPVLARGLEDSLWSAGYRTFICNTDAEEEREQEFLGDVVHRRVDGVVMVAFHLGEREIAEVIDTGMSIVSIGSRIIDHSDVDVVMVDDETGAFDGTTRLASAGHRRIAMIRGAEGSGIDREAGYQRALEAAGMGVDPELLVYGNWTRHGGAEAMRALMALPNPPSAVFCGNDLMAIGAMDTLRSLGCSIPDDVALVGFDDIEAAALVTPGLTTLLNPAYDTGRTAGQLLLDRMAGDYRGGRRMVTLPCPLVVREST